MSGAADVHLLDFQREIVVEFQVVDDELAGAFADPDPGDGRLPPAGAPGELVLCRRRHDRVFPSLIVPSPAVRRRLGFDSTRSRCVAVTMPLGWLALRASRPYRPL